MTSSTRLDIVKLVTYNDIDLEDTPIGIQLEDYNSSTERLLTLVNGPSRVMPYLNTMLNSVTYEINH